MPDDPTLQPPPDSSSPWPDEELEQLLARLYPQLRQILARHRVPFDDADDVLQDALLVLLRKAHQVRNPEAYLVTTLQYRCRMYWRARAHQRSLRAEQELLEEVAVPGPLPQQCATQRLDLERCLASLPAPARRLVRLRYGLGYTARELAPLLGLSVDAVRQRSVYARRRFSADLRHAELP
ncbi:MAG: sigma-70 family RNA polymerase sigma factor [Acidobacteriota bacterium]